jgi:hypothetical protein
MMWIIVASVVALLLFGVLRMAGGSAEDHSFGAYPTGERSVVLVQTPPVSMLASQTAAVFDQITMPFKGRLVRAEFVGVVANTPTIYVHDDSSTAKEIIGVTASYVALVASAAVAKQSVAVSSTPVINSGAIITCKYTTAAGETTTGAVLRLWFHPL